LIIHDEKDNVATTIAIGIVPKWTKKVGKISTCKFVKKLIINFKLIKLF